MKETINKRIELKLNYANIGELTKFYKADLIKLRNEIDQKIYLIELNKDITECGLKITPHFSIFFKNIYDQAVSLKEDYSGEDIADCLDGDILKMNLAKIDLLISSLEKILEPLELTT
jgi:hypothetical protein